MKRQRMNNNGFTLIETTVAMLVMMVVGLGATSLFLYSVRYNSGASQRSVAMAVAQERLEVLRAADYDAADLSFGTRAPETVVVSPYATTGSSTPSAGVDGYGSYDAPVTASSYSGAFNPNANPNRQPTPTPTPTPGGGGGGTGGVTGAPSGSNTYQIQTAVVPFPIGTSAASATQKRITIRVVPVNGNGNNSWANQNPIELVFHRSIGASGPYKQ